MPRLYEKDGGPRLPLEKKFKVKHQQEKKRELFLRTHVWKNPNLARVDKSTCGYIEKRRGTVSRLLRVANRNDVQIGPKKTRRKKKYTASAQGNL